MPQPDVVNKLVDKQPSSEMTNVMITKTSSDGGGKSGGKHCDVYVPRCMTRLWQPSDVSQTVALKASIARAQMMPVD